MIIPLKTKKEIDLMREGGKLLAQIMAQLQEKAIEGVSTKDLNEIAEALIFDYNAKPAFKNYQAKKEKNLFPFALCVSVDDVVVHGAPSNYVLRKGDIVGLDLGLEYKGYFTDMAITLIVGEANSPEAVKLVKTAKKALKIGIDEVKEGVIFEAVSRKIQNYVEGQGFSVITELCGHGIDKQLHEDPSIPNYVDKKANSHLRIKEGMVFCLEPMISAGRAQLEKSDDGFGYRTKDGSLTAHFEHTIAVVNGKPQVLTKL
ncbi:type I methionyl aminopeptidase [Candidatus Parcubacteria bacterium]|nr:type I methionyl aminopeptidase [Candidatus Parcubacteria bacterium]